MIEHRDYQVRIRNKTVNAFRQNLNSVLIESPTGSGKTIIGLSICKILKEENNKLRIGWSAMRRKLLIQAQRESERVGIDNIEFISMFDKKPPEVDLLVVDEAQHDAASSNQNLINNTKTKWRIGLTATPFRTDRIKLAFDKVVNDCGIRYLVEQGYLSKYNLYYIPKWTPEYVSDAYLRGKGIWGKSVMFFHTKEDCVKTNEILKSNGVKSECIFGDMSFEQQIEIMDAYDSGHIDVLLNVYLLTEGFDSTDLTTVFVRDSSKLPTIQMSGRGMRLYPKEHKLFNTPKNIIQSECTKYPFMRVVNPINEFIWEESSEKWLTLNNNERIENVSALVREKIFTAPPRETLLDIKVTSISVGVDGKVKHKKKKKKVSSGFNVFAIEENDE